LVLCTHVETQATNISLRG